MNLADETPLKNGWTGRISVSFPGRDSRGMSLLETALAVAMIGIIMSVLISNAVNQFDRSRQSRALQDMRSLANAARQYRLQEGWWPSNWLDLTIEGHSRSRPILDYNMDMVHAPGGGLHPADPWTGFYTLRCFIRQENAPGLFSDAVGWVPKTWQNWQESGILLVDNITVVSPGTPFEVMVVSTSYEFNEMEVNLGISEGGETPPSLASATMLVEAEKVIFAGLERAAQ